MIRVLVTGVGGNASMNVVRALRAYFPFPIVIIGTDTNRYQLAASSANVKCLLSADKSWDQQILDIANTYNVDFIHPQTDRELMMAAKSRSLFDRLLYIPSLDTITLCQDKLKINNLLHEKKIPVPVSKPFSAHCFNRMGGKKVWVRAIQGAGSRAALPIVQYDQAVQWINYWDERDGLKQCDFMISEYLPGREFAFQSIWHKGQLITSFARERLEYMFGGIMPSKQSSSPSVALSVHDERVNQIATAAVLAVDEVPHGIFCVDMKGNESGTPCVTEINAGRFFTTSNFAAAAGCNMPGIFLSLFLGHNMPSVQPYNAIPADLYWIRGVDREPLLLTKDELEKAYRRQHEPQSN